MGRQMDPQNHQDTVLGTSTPWWKGGKLGRLATTELACRTVNQLRQIGNY